MARLRSAKADLRQAAYIVVSAAVAASTQFYQSIFMKIRKRDGKLQGHAWLKELMRSPNTTRLHDALGMAKHVFQQLVLDLQTCGGLTHSRWVCAAEQVAIFLCCIRDNQTNRRLSERFQRSGDTISRCVVISNVFPGAERHIADASLAF